MNELPSVPGLQRRAKGLPLPNVAECALLDRREEAELDAVSERVFAYGWKTSSPCFRDEGAWQCQEGQGN